MKEINGLGFYVKQAEKYLKEMELGKCYLKILFKNTIIYFSLFFQFPISLPHHLFHSDFQ